MENSTLAPLASILDRFIALIIDYLILAIPCIMVHFALPFIGPLIVGLLYYPIFHASPLKATLGKRAVGVQVISADGQTLSLPMSFLRFFVASASTAALFLGHYFAFFTPKKQALHDLAAGSFVVHGRSDTNVMDAWLTTLRRLFGRLEAEAPKIWRDKATSTKNKVDELERLHGLKAKGAITDEEYERLKRDLMQ